MRNILVIVFCAVLLLSCNPPGVYQKDTPDNEFTILTYNVAGLPQGISSSNPLTNMPQIGQKLNLFDIVLVQEDFSYHYNLRYGDGHPYESVFDSFHGTVGDGLNSFSYCKFTDLQRVTWDACYGVFGHANDCLTPKGFMFARYEISSGVYVDIYDLHMDAGSSAGDNEARIVGVEQLIDKINTSSAGQAVIICGDFNMSYNDPEDNINLTRLISSTGLTDSRIELGNTDERIDKILYRSSGEVSLTPVVYKVESDTFLDSKGRQLSDHEAVSVLFRWEKI
jgi:hypothetical protein